MKLTLKQLKQLISEAVHESMGAGSPAAKGWHILESGRLSREVFASKEEAMGAAQKRQSNIAHGGEMGSVEAVVLVAESIPVG